MTPVEYAVAVGAGALTGFVCAVPVGPINVAIMEVGIHSGRTRALIIAVGALLMEMIYCVIAFGGFASLFENPTIRATVELISFLAVTVFGIRYLMTDTVTVQGKRARMIEQRLHPHTMFWTGFVRVLVNPNVLLFWIMICCWPTERCNPPGKAGWPVPPVPAWALPPGLRCSCWEVPGCETSSRTGRSCGFPTYPVFSCCCCRW